MTKKHLSIMIITSITILLPILVGVLLWEQLPQQLPIHWNMAGEVDSWGSKPMVVIGMPLVLLALHWIAILATLSDPKKRNHPQKILALLYWLVPTLSIVLMALTYSAGTGSEIRVEKICTMLVGLLLVFIGNYLPKAQQNYTIGIRLPWTLHSEENWNKTHRLAGWIAVVCGLAILFFGFFGLLWPIPLILLILVIVPLIYSYLLHRKGV